MKNSGSILLAAIIALVGCKKDTTQQNVRELLTSKTWRLSAIYIDGKLQGPYDCKLDNTYDFQKDGIMKFEENELKCQPSDPASLQFNWVLDENNYLTTSRPGFRDVDKLTSAGSEKLVLDLVVEQGRPGERVEMVPN